jgi:hypothetical protein
MAARFTSVSAANLFASRVPLKEFEQMAITGFQTCQPDLWDWLQRYG